MTKKLIPFIIALFLLLIGGKGYCQITLKGNNSPVDQILDEITRQTGYTFIYKEGDIKRKTITVDLKNVSLNEALTACFKEFPMDFQIVKKTIVLKPAIKVENSGPTPLFNIHGHVYDETHQVLVSASVRIIGSEVRFASTNENGAFDFREVPMSGKIVGSFIGYRTDTVNINGRDEIDIILQPQLNQIKEVTVSTGYQTRIKESATGAFGKPDMQIFNMRTSSNDIVTRLEGLITGLAVNPNSTINSINNGQLSIASGARFANVSANGRAMSLIRGTNSVGLASEPLYVVNGVPVTNFFDINPDDVADITVLKDASAAAIWGAKAGNGVIVINTKSGIRNRKIKIDYSGYVNFMGKPDLRYIPVLNSSQYIQAAKEAFDPITYPYNSLATSFIAPHEQILYDQYAGTITANQANYKLDSLSKISNTRQIMKLLYQNAVTTHQTVSASGGGRFYAFYSSLSYTENQTSTPGTSNQMYQVDINQNIRPNRFILISLNTSFNNIVGSSKRPIVPQGNFLPYQLFRDINGNNINMNYEQGLSAVTRADYQERSHVNLDYYPLQDVNTGYTNANNITVNITGNLSVKLLKGLSFDGTYGYSKRPGTDIIYDDISNYRMRQQLINFTVAPANTSTPVYYLPDTGGKYQHVRIDETDWTVRNQLRYNLNARQDRDHLNIQIGQEEREQDGTSESSIHYGYNLRSGTYPLLNYPLLNQGILGAVGTGYSIFYEQLFSSISIINKFTSLFGLLNYTFDNKYGLDISIRRDHSNVFAFDHASTRRPIYSLGGKWNLRRETFMQTINWLNGLGVRATLGITGNAPGPGQTSKDVLNAVTDPTSGPYYQLSSAANDKLSWESTRVINLGIDFAVFNNRLTGSVDAYYKKTIDLLGTLVLNPLSGFPSAYGNIGSLYNKGLELGLHSINLQSKKMSWVTSATLSYNKNKLLFYPNAQASLFSASGIIGYPFIVGYPLSPLLAYRYAGLDNVGDPRIRLAGGSVTKVPNSGKYTDVEYMGTQIPPINGALINTFRYTNFSLTANIVYNIGGVMRRDVNTFYTGRLTGTPGAFDGNVNSEFAERWKKPGDENFTNIPSYVASGSINYTRRNTDYYRLADINILSSSYAKLRDLTLSYDLSSKITRVLKVERINVYAQTGNYLLWKNNHYGIDPEYQTVQGTRLVPPYTHTFSLGANVTF